MMNNSKTYYIIKFGEYFLEGEMGRSRTTIELYLTESDFKALRFGTKEKAIEAQNKIGGQIVKVTKTLEEVEDDEE